MLYNLQELRSIASGDEVFFNEMIKLFIQQNETSLVEIKNQVSKRDLAAIKMILHKIKPSVMVMGIAEASEIIKQVEQLELSTVDNPEFPGLLQQLENILLEVNDQLRMV